MNPNQPPLTEKQKATLDYLVSFIKENLFQPSFREIALHLEVSSPNAAKYHLEALERKGWLQMNGEQRALVLTNRTIKEYNLFFK